MKSPINWKGGIALLVFSVLFYAGWIYLMFFSAATADWEGRSQNIKYPIAIIGPFVLAYGVFQKFRGK